MIPTGESKHKDVQDEEVRPALTSVAEPNRNNVGVVTPTVESNHKDTEVSEASDSGSESSPPHGMLDSSSDEDVHSPANMMDPVIDYSDDSDDDDDGTHLRRLATSDVRQAFKQQISYIEIGDAQWPSAIALSNWYRHETLLDDTFYFGYANLLLTQHAAPKTSADNAPKTPADEAAIMNNVFMQAAKIGIGATSLTNDDHSNTHRLGVHPEIFSDDSSWASENYNGGPPDPTSSEESQGSDQDATQVTDEEGPKPPHSLYDKLVVLEDSGTKFSLTEQAQLHLQELGVEGFRKIGSGQPADVTRPVAPSDSHKGRNAR